MNDARLNANWKEDQERARDADKLDSALRLAAAAFYLADEMGRAQHLGYDAGVNAELRSIHARLPKNYHRDDCDGCFANESASQPGQLA